MTAAPAGPAFPFREAAGLFQYTKSTKTALFPPDRPHIMNSCIQDSVCHMNRIN